MFINSAGARTRAIRFSTATGNATNGVARRGTGSRTPTEISGHCTPSMRTHGWSGATFV
jgi:transcription elongation factor